MIRDKRRASLTAKGFIKLHKAWRIIILPWQHLAGIRDGTPRFCSGLGVDKEEAVLGVGPRGTATRRIKGLGWKNFLLYSKLAWAMYVGRE